VNVHRKGLIYKNPRSQEGVELELRGNYCIEDTKIKFKPGQGYLYLLYSKDRAIQGSFANCNISVDLDLFNEGIIEYI
jgi:hypothetical protein